MEPWNSSPYPSSRSAADADALNSPIQFPAALPLEPEDREPVAQPDPDRFPPVLVVFSSSGGAGETGIVANLSRALAAQGEDVLLLDAFLENNLARCFGVEPPVLGAVTLVSRPGSGVRLRLAQTPVARHDPGGDGDVLFLDELAALATDCDRILIDLSTASPLLIWQIFRLSPLLLVPIMPGWNAVLSVSLIHRLLRQVSRPDRLPVQPKFLLTQFDPEISFHRTVRDELRSRLGVGLLPLALHRGPALDEAFDLGMTVLDACPDGRASQDFLALAGWIRTHYHRPPREAPCAAEQAS